MAVRRLFTRSAAKAALRDRSGVPYPRSLYRATSAGKQPINRQCPEGVKSGSKDLLLRCPLYPQKRTSQNAVGMSALCQKRTLLDLCQSVPRTGPDDQLRLTKPHSRIGQI